MSLKIKLPPTAFKRERERTSNYLHLLNGRGFYRSIVMLSAMSSHMLFE
jgi:hypothetical protein